jgi:hypothetical protein
MKTMNLLIMLNILHASTRAAEAGSPPTAAFTYQGQLKQEGVPLNGDADLEFSLWFAEAGGDQIGPTLTFDSVPVIHGLLTVELDFGAASFNGNARWLEINVRSPHDPGGTGPFTTLSPRQPLNAIPYAGFAARPWASDKVNVFYTGGNVGIGTTAPALPLHVNGKARFGNIVGTGTGVSIAPDVNTGRDGFHCTNGPDRRLEIYTWGSYNDIKSLGAPLTINHDSQENVFLCANGENVGIGTTNPTNRLSVNGSANFSGFVGIETTTPQYRLHIQSDSTGLFAETTNSSGVVAGIVGRASATSGVGIAVRGDALSPDGFGGFFTGGRNYFGGNVGIGILEPSVALDVVGNIEYTGTITDVSDERLKENIAPLAGALLKIGQLSGVYFNMKNAPNQREVGLIAQNVNEVLPEAVRVVDPRTGHLGVSYPSLVPLLVEAVKEQQKVIHEQMTTMDLFRVARDAEIAARDSEIAQLKTRLARLEKAILRTTSQEEKRRGE